MTEDLTNLSDLNAVAEAYDLSTIRPAMIALDNRIDHALADEQAARHLQWLNETFGGDWICTPGV